jgi:RNA polymerase sigma-70 factor (ECF subfamily)
VPDAEERFRAIFDDCHRPVTAYARRRTGPADADDVVAEVFLVAWRRLDDVPADRALPWLYGVARGVLANRRRAAGRREQLLHRLAVEPHSDAPPATDPGVEAALAVLRPEDREVLRLAAWESLAASEIAVVLGCSPNAAALRLSRARARLRRALTGTDDTRTRGARRVTDA